jgi:hypothetical protein
MLAGTLYSKIDWAVRSPPPNRPPMQVMWDMARLTVSPENSLVRASTRRRICSS